MQRYEWLRRMRTFQPHVLGFCTTTKTPLLFCTVIASVEIAWTCFASIWFFFIVPPLESIQSLLDTYYTFTKQWCHISYKFCCLVGHISVRKDILMSLRLFSWINKEYAKLPKTECSFFFVSGMLFVAQNDFTSFMRGRFDICLTNNTPTSRLQHFKYGQSFFGRRSRGDKKYPTPNMRTVLFYFNLFVFFGDETVREYRPEEKSVV